MKLSRYIRSSLVKANGSKVSGEKDILISGRGSNVKVGRDLALEEREDAEVRFASAKFNLLSAIGDFKELPFFGGYRLYSMALWERLIRRESMIFPINDPIEGDTELHDPMISTQITDLNFQNIIPYVDTGPKGTFIYSEDGVLFGEGTFSEVADLHVIRLEAPYDPPAPDVKSFYRVHGKMTYLVQSINFDPAPNSVVVNGIIDAPGVYDPYNGKSGTMVFDQPVVDDPYDRFFVYNLVPGGPNYGFPDLRGGKYLLDFDISIVSGTIGTNPGVANISIYFRKVVDDEWELVFQSFSSASGSIDFNTDTHSDVVISVYSAQADPGILGTWSVTHVEPLEAYLESAVGETITSPYREDTITLRMELGKVDVPENTNVYDVPIIDGVSQQATFLLNVPDGSTGTAYFNFVCEGVPYGIVEVEDYYQYLDYYQYFLNQADFIKFHIQTSGRKFRAADLEFQIQYLGRNTELIQD